MANNKWKRLLCVLESGLQFVAEKKKSSSRQEWGKESFSFLLILLSSPIPIWHSKSITREKVISHHLFNWIERSGRKKGDSMVLHVSHRLEQFNRPERRNYLLKDHRKRGRCARGGRLLRSSYQLVRCGQTRTSQFWLFYLADDIANSTASSRAPKLQLYFMAIRQTTNWSTQCNTEATSSGVIFNINANLQYERIVDDITREDSLQPVSRRLRFTRKTESFFSPAFYVWDLALNVDNSCWLCRQWLVGRQRKQPDRAEAI